MFFHFMRICKLILWFFIIFWVQDERAFFIFMAPNSSEILLRLPSAKEKLTLENMISFFRLPDWILFQKTMENKIIWCLHYKSWWIDNISNIIFTLFINKLSRKMVISLKNIFLKETFSHLLFKFHFKIAIGSLYSDPPRKSFKTENSLEI